VHKIPNLVEFYVTNGIPPDFAVAHSCLDLSSDHSPVLVTLTSQPIRPDLPPRLSNRLTNWDYFKLQVVGLLLQIPLKTKDDIEEAVKFFTDTVQWAGWKATPPLPARTGINACPLIIQQQQNVNYGATGTPSEHQRAKDYLMQQHDTSNNSSVQSRTIKSKLFFKNLHPR
jgi:hypothetical protein